MHIRDERREDAHIIYQLTKAAFSTMPFSAGDEHDLIDALRHDGALAISLVAERRDEIVGHIAFSNVKIDGQPSRWFDLGPLSVKPELQSLGIGSALVREGLQRLVGLDADGCVVLGHPSYYGRFGFRHDPGLTYDGAVNPNFQQLALKGTPARGAVSFHPAFYH